MTLAQQLGPLVLKMAGHARSVTLAQAARQAPKVLPELLRQNAEIPGVMLWVNQGGSVDACDEDGVTLLMRQVNQGKAQLAERLLQMRANVDAVDKRGRTALMGASGSGREEEVAAPPAPSFTLSLSLALAPDPHPHLPTLSPTPSPTPTPILSPTLSPILSPTLSPILSPALARSGCCSTTRPRLTWWTARATQRCCAPAAWGVSSASSGCSGRAPRRTSRTRAAARRCTWPSSLDTTRCALTAGPNRNPQRRPPPPHHRPPPHRCPRLDTGGCAAARCAA